MVRFNTEKYGHDGTSMGVHPEGKYVRYDDLPWVVRALDRLRKALKTVYTGLPAHW